MLDKTIGSLSILLNAKDQNLTSTIDGVRAGLISFTKDLAALAGIGLSVAGVVAGLKEALNFGGNMYDLSKQTGVAVNELVVLRQALDETGVGAGRAMFIINMMQRNLANLAKTKGGREVIKELGLNMKEIAKMTPMDKLKTLGTALSNIPEKDRMDALTKLFGRGGMMLRGFFADPNAIKDVEQALGRFPALVAKNAKSFDAIGDVLSRWKYIRLGLFTGIMEGIAPTMKAISEAVAKLDFSGIGQKIGRWVLMFVNLLTKGTLKDFLILEFEYMFSWIHDNWPRLVKWMSLVFSSLFQIAIAGIMMTMNESKLGKWLNLPEDKVLKNNIGTYSKILKGAGEALFSGGVFQESEQTKEIGQRLREMKRDMVIEAIDMIETTQDGQVVAANAKPEAVIASLPAFIRKYAPAAIQGTAEGYRAEMGMSKSMDKVADNTEATASNTEGLKPAIEQLSTNLDFAVQGEG